jgi:hypothetical protein
MRPVTAPGVHPRRWSATTVLLIRLAARTHGRARRKAIRHQGHHQQNQPNTPHTGIIGDVGRTYEKLEETNSSGRIWAPLIIWVPHVSLLRHGK